MTSLYLTVSLMQILEVWSLKREAAGVCLMSMLHAKGSGPTAGSKLMVYLIRAR